MAIAILNDFYIFLLPTRLYVEERLYTHPLFELARSDTSRVVDRNGASTRWEPVAKILWKLDKICRLHQLPDYHLYKILEAINIIQHSNLPGTDSQKFIS